MTDLQEAAEVLLDALDQFDGQRFTDSDSSPKSYISAYARIQREAMEALL